MNRRYQLARRQDPKPSERGRTGLPPSIRSSERFWLTDEELNTHVLIFGTTGSGKSRCLQQLLREHHRLGRGFCLVEPGDLVDDFLAYCARYVMQTGDESLLEKLHVVELSPFQLARYDLFRFHYPKFVHPEMRDNLYRSWQHTKVQSVAEIYQWKQGQSTNFEGMPTLQRNFINVFTAVTTLVERRRLSAAEADILVDLGHPDHDRVYHRLAPRLPREIVADFEVLHDFRNVRDLRQEVGSFLNRIRTTHGPLFKAMVATGGELPTLDLFAIVQRGDFLLVKTAKTPFASDDQNNALASVFVHDTIETMLVTPRELRKEFTLVIDEAHRVVRPGIGDVARVGRKYGLGLVLATTDLVSLRREELDLASELLNVVNTVMSFRMTWPEDLRLLAEYLFAQNLDFTELVHEVERRAGHLWVPVDEWSESTSRQTSTGRSEGHSTSHGSSTQQGTSRTTNTSRGTSAGAEGKLASASTTTGDAQGHNTSQGHSESTGRQTSVSSSESQGESVTINHKLVHLDEIVREPQKTGSLETSVEDQVARFAQRLSSLPQRRAFVRVRDRAAQEIESLDVPDPFRSPEAQARAVEWIKRRLYEVQPYYFTPCLDDDEQRRRLDAFVGDEAAEPDTVDFRSRSNDSNPLL